MAMGEVQKTKSINAQSFEISKQQFFDQPMDLLTSTGVKYTRAPPPCSQRNRYLFYGSNLLAADADVDDAPTANAANNFNADEDPTAAAEKMTQAVQGYHPEELLHFWLGFSTACGPFNQFAICKDNTKLWGTSIYAREQAVICSNSLSDLCTSNSVSVSPLESIIAGKRHCGVFIDVKMSDINAKATAAGPPLSPKTEYYYLIPEDITFSGKLRIIIFITLDVGFPARFKSQNPDIVYLMLAQAEDIINYERYIVRIVNMSGSAADAKEPQKTISQIQNAKFNKLEIQNVCFNVENEEAIVELIRNQRLINFPTQVLRAQSTNYPFVGFKTGNSLQSIMSFSNIKSIFMTFAMPQYPTWFFPVLFQGFDLIINQRHVIPTPYEALTQIVNSQIPLLLNFTPLMHYLCDAVVRFMFDDAPDPQVLSMEVIGEIRGSMVRSG
ncbi:MAG: hypothetical protein EZS28_004860 [Streblomastix strix]|uniref:Uncharacterized protein n=1 Tax=Streblomastix strix TaxID=222440 RepID=A0A5J4WYL6_9EUKA|nr:MAG: hypothetical protein EZS28_004860 [Streblomastix strix]